MARLRARRQAQLGGAGTSLGSDTIAGGLKADSVIRMPDPGDPALAESSRIRMEKGRRTGGRLGTILSDSLRRRLKGIDGEES